MQVAKLDTSSQKSIDFRNNVQVPERDTNNRNDIDVRNSVQVPKCDINSQSRNSHRDHKPSPMLLNSLTVLCFILVLMYMYMYQ